MTDAAKKKLPPKPRGQKRALKEARFVAEYLKDQNGTRAMLRMKPHMTRKSAGVEASKLLAKPSVRRKVGLQAQKQIEKAGLTVELVLEAIRRNVDAAAHGDKRALFDGRGNSKPIHRLTREQADLIAGYEVVLKNAKAGDGHIDEVLKVKLANFEKYVELAAKYFNLLSDHVVVSGDDELIALLQGARTRVDKADHA